MRTLNEIDPCTIITNVPYTITVPGRYCLATNLFGGTGVNGITVAADGVTIDLNGFELRGAVDSQTAIATTNTRRNLAIRNGTIRGWDVGAVRCGSVINGNAENLFVVQNAEYAIVLGSNALVRSCVSQGNTFNAAGIDVGAGSLVRDCVTRGNQNGGIKAGAGSAVHDSVANANIGDGIEVGAGGLVSGCVSSTNTQNGISVGSAAVVQGCLAQGNMLDGIIVGNAAVVSDCVSADNGELGISSGTALVAARCIARNNGSSGIFASQEGGQIIGCRAIENGTDGIFINGGSVLDSSTEDNTQDGIEIGGGIVRNCRTTFDGAAGIRAGGDALLLGNSIDQGPPNGSRAGIRLVGNRTRVEGNNISNGDHGIRVDFDGNLIIRNSVSGANTNYLIAANNKVGPIVAAPNSPAINGSTGGSGIGSTDPSANISF